MASSINADRVAKDSISIEGMSDEEIAQHVAASFGQLSFRERDDALNDINGVPDIVEETQKLLKDGIALLNREIELIENKSAYNMALQQSPSYVNRYSFQLRFLRADRFDARKAAQRLVTHFERKLELFGEAPLGREIQSSDLSKDEMEALRTGYIRVLPLRDQAGRLVVFFAKSLIPPNMTLEIRLRLAWYIANLASHDETSQKKGLVLIYWLIGSNHSESDPKWGDHSGRNALPILVRFVDAISVRISALHTCFKENSYRNVMNFGAMVVGMAVRVRIKPHSGSLSEVLYSLMPYGIPKLILPVDDSGTVETASFLKWLECHHKAMEEPKSERALSQPSSLAVFDTPGESDILLGRGRLIEGSPGNVRLKRIIESNIAKYERASRFERTSVAHAVFLRLKQNGSKFLRKEGGRWFEVDEQTSRDKISHSFRNLRRHKGQALALQQQLVQQQVETPVSISSQIVFNTGGEEASKNRQDSSCLF